MSEYSTVSSPSDSTNVAAAERTMLILEHLSQYSHINLEDLAKASDLPKATLYRFLQTLTSLGYVNRDENDRYSLTLRMFSIGSRSLEYTDMLTVARPIAKNLCDATGETVHIGVLDSTRAVYVMKIESAHTIRMFSRVGKHIPLHCTAIGKIFLADMSTQEQIAVFSKIRGKNPTFKKYTPHTFTTDEDLQKELMQVRSIGYARDKEEHEEGITCIAAPIFNDSGAAAAAISVSYPCFRFPKEKTEEIIAQICEAGREISKLIGYTGPIPKK